MFRGRKAYLQCLKPLIKILNELPPHELGFPIFVDGAKIWVGMSGHLVGGTRRVGGGGEGEIWMNLEWMKWSGKGVWFGWVGIASYP